MTYSFLHIHCTYIYIAVYIVIVDTVDLKYKYF